MLNTFLGDIYINLCAHTTVFNYLLLQLKLMCRYQEKLITDHTENPEKSYRNLSAGVRQLRDPVETT